MHLGILPQLRRLLFFRAPAHWDKLRIVHCGIEPARYDGAPGGTGPILFVGRLAAVKGVPVLMEALEPICGKAPELKVSFIGDGPERPAIEAACKGFPHLSKVVTFHGYLGQEEVAKALGSASMLVLPSFAEGVPVVLMEAMAAGKPVVATNVGGVTELVRDGVSGRVLAPGDVDALRTAIDGLLNDAAARERMGAAGRETVTAEYDASEEAARLGILLVSAMSGAAHPAKRPGAAR